MLRHWNHLFYSVGTRWRVGTGRRPTTDAGLSSPKTALECVFSEPVEFKGFTDWKLLVDSVLNSVTRYDIWRSRCREYATNVSTRRGPYLGNSAGVVALTYNCINSAIGSYRGKHDTVNSLTAGALSGMLFKSTKGVRPMLISGAMVASAAGIWTVCHIISIHDNDFSHWPRILQVARQALF